MIKFKRITLSNGLVVVAHKDSTTPLLALNLIYKVGSRDETSRRTGFAHLFEHLMFTGSQNIPKFDKPLEQAGGQNNAFTNADYTSYFLTIPSNNKEIAFWLESDRMNKLKITDNSLNIQKSVVIEEFKQNYLNRPYGDAYLLLKPLAYKVHPYRWNPIGKNPEHISNASLSYVRNFYKKFYNPNNAILSVAGDFSYDEIEELSYKWFGDITAGPKVERNYPVEPKQKHERRSNVVRDVPQNAIYMAFPMCDRYNRKYYAADLISDILSNGRSSRLYRRLVIDNQYFTEVNAFISGDIDNGLFIISGKLLDNISFEKAEEMIMEEISQIINGNIADDELIKVKNKAESHLSFVKSSVLSKAMTLSYYEMLGDAELSNKEIIMYDSVSKADIALTAQEMFDRNNLNILTYSKSGK